jgi:tetratricopeptide (TPR) repeat protein
MVPAFAESSNTSYETLKADARNAHAAGDLRKAAGKYAELLTMAEQSRPGVYETYANVVSPLAEIYRKLDETDKVEQLYIRRVEHATRAHVGDSLELGLAQADLGFHYQHSDVSADRFHGERLILTAIKTFEHCSTSKQVSEQCRRRLADTAGIQGAIYFQNLDYKRAEPLFRRVISAPEDLVQAEVLFVSLHALRGILILRKENDEARALEQRAALVEAKNHAALARLRGAAAESTTRSRSR